MAGVVDEVYVQLGQQVQAGQELVRMDDTDARKELATAEASLASSAAGAAERSNRAGRRRSG